MRRAFLAVLAGCTLLAGSACNDEATSRQAAATPPASAGPRISLPPDYTADNEKVCARLQTLYTTELRAFGAELGKMVTYKEAKQTAEAEKAEKAAAGHLRAAATKIRKETGAAANPDFQAAGKVSAAKLEAAAKDRRYLDRIKSLDDLNKTAKTQFVEWLTPAAGYCGVGYAP